MAGNPFDKFDAPQSGNPFDRFDAAPAVPAVPANKRKWTASDVVKEPLRMASEGIAGILNLPVKAAKGIGGLAHVGGQLLRGNDLDTALAKGTEFIGDRNAITSPWKSKVMEATGENVVLPTVQKLSSMTGIPIEALAGTIEAGGDIVSLIGLGAGAKSPLAAAARATKNVAGKTADMTADQLTKLVLKQPSKMTRKQRNENVQTALEGGYRATEKGTAKLNKDIEVYETGLDEALTQAQAQGVSGTFDKAIANIEALRTQAKHSSRPKQNMQAIDDAVAELKAHDLAQNGVVGIADLQGMKVMQGRELQTQYVNGMQGKAPDSFSTMIDKARVRGLKEEINDVMAKNGFEQLIDINGRLSKLYQLKKVIDPAANRIENSSQLGGMGYKAGVGGMLGQAAGLDPAVGAAVGTAIGLAQNPYVSPRIAGALHKLNGRKPLDYISPDNLLQRHGLMSGTVGSSFLRDNEN